MQISNPFQRNDREIRKFLKVIYGCDEIGLSWILLNKDYLSLTLPILGNSTLKPGAFQ